MRGDGEEVHNFVGVCVHVYARVYGCTCMYVHVSTAFTRTLCV